MPYLTGQLSNLEINNCSLISQVMDKNNINAMISAMMTSTMIRIHGWIDNCLKLLKLAISDVLSN